MIKNIKCKQFFPARDAALFTLPEKMDARAQDTDRMLRLLLSRGPGQTDGEEVEATLTEGCNLPLQTVERVQNLEAMLSVPATSQTLVCIRDNILVKNVLLHRNQCSLSA